MRLLLSFTVSRVYLRTVITDDCLCRLESRSVKARRLGNTMTEVNNLTSIGMHLKQL